MQPANIVIIGAGYAGLTAAFRLQKQSSKAETTITLISKHDYHYQTTWLHRNAVGSLPAKKTKFTLHSLLDTERVRIVTDIVEHIDIEKKRIQTQMGVFPYDYLIVALGSEIDPLHIPGLKNHAYSISTLAKSLQLYHRITNLLKQYSQTSKSQSLHFVIGGVGFTGVELLGELTDQLPKLCQPFNIDPKKIKLTAIEHEPTVLPEFDLELGEYAMQKLEAKGVELRLGTKIKAVYQDQIKIEQSGLVEDIPADLFVWTAGVKGNHLIDLSDIPAKEGRVEVNCDLTAPGYPEVFVIGDVALIRKQDQTPYLPNADLAVQKGRLAANNVLLSLRGSRQLHTLSIKNNGTIASIGAKDAIGINRKHKKLFGRNAAILKKLSNYKMLYRIGGFHLLSYYLFNKTE